MLEDLRRDFLLRFEPAQAFFVNQQDSIEYAMLAHQIFGRRDLLGRIFLFTVAGRFLMVGAGAVLSVCDWR